MSKDAQTAVVLNEQAQEKFEQCVAALAACGFGSEGPPVDTSFAQIEKFGHEVGRMLARAVDERLAAQHAQHFQNESACPVCQTACAPDAAPLRRQLQTIDGHIPLCEPLCHCPVCHRDFFPGAQHAEARRPLLQSVCVGEGDALRGP